jgi:hypothetical protein
MRDGRLVDELACSVDRMAAGKLHTPGEVATKRVRVVLL